MSSSCRNSNGIVRVIWCRGTRLGICYGSIQRFQLGHGLWKNNWSGHYFLWHRRGSLCGRSSSGWSSGARRPYSCCGSSSSMGSSSTNSFFVGVTPIGTRAGGSGLRRAMSAFGFRPGLKLPTNCARVHMSRSRTSDVSNSGLSWNFNCFSIRNSCGKLSANLNT